MPIAALGKTCATSRQSSADFTLLDKAAVGADQPGTLFGTAAAQGTQLTAVSSKKLVTLSLQDGKASVERRVTSSSEFVSGPLRKFIRRPRDWRVVGSVVGGKEVVLALEHKKSRKAQLVLFRSKSRAPRQEAIAASSSLAEFLTNP